MRDFTLYTSSTIGKASTTSFPNKQAISDKQSLGQAIQFDHVTATYKNNYRKGDNFISSDVVVLDCDNDHSDDPKDWVEPFDVSMAFPNVTFAVTYSRNHNKVKGKKSARPRFHVYFPIDVISDKDEYKATKQAARQSFPYFDDNAMDVARLIYGTTNDEVEIYEGSKTLSQFLNDDLFADWDKAQNQITEGNRNNTMSHIAGKLIKRYGNTESSHTNFLNLAAEKCVPALSVEELTVIWNSAVSFGNKIANQADYIPPEQYNTDSKLEPTDYSDVGQAVVLAREYDDVLRFSPKLGYLVFNGQYWTMSEESAIGIAQELTDRQLEEIDVELAKVTEEMKKNGAWDVLANVGVKKAATIFNPRQQRSYQRYESVLQYQKYAIKRRDSRYIKSALAMVEPHIPIEVEQLDANEFLLNTPKATYNLITGQAKAHTASDFITQQTALSPSEKGIQMWQEALDVIFCGDEDLKVYVQKIVGLAAIGKVKQEALIIAYGDGQNGKSTFWNSIFRVLGSYAGTLSSEIITANNRANSKNEKAELRGKRFVIAGELEENQRLSTSMVKQLTSTDPIKGEKKYRDEFVFIPTHTLVLYTNHLPKVSANDKGTWRRLLVVPLNAKITASEDKKNYGDELYQKAGGAILQWVIDGAKKVIAEEFKPNEPQAVIDATSKYKQENDWLSDFFEECCELDEIYSEKSGEVYDAYRAHCQRIGDWARSQAHFYSAVERAGIVKTRKNNTRYFKGLRLKPEESGF
jgi:P4 family phage/plasmid primase-like protien